VRRDEAEAPNWNQDFGPSLLEARSPMLPVRDVAVATAVLAYLEERIDRSQRLVEAILRLGVTQQQLCSRRPHQWSSISRAGEPTRLGLRGSDERKVGVSGAAGAPLQRYSPHSVCIFGGPGRTRTCNQTVMSGRLSIRFVDFAEVLFRFDRVCFGSFRLFLVRNWCGNASMRCGTGTMQ
jgi:hypothetical protein